MRKFYSCSIILLCLSAIATAAIAEEEKPQLDCEDPLNSAPIAVKQTLGPLYRTDPPADKLGEAHAALQIIVAGTTNCRLYVQSSGSNSDRSLVNEWISLHDWINRIADFIYLKSKGRERNDWRREYSDFAEVYEFEA